MTTDVLARLEELRIIPVVEIDDAAHAVPLAATLAGAGLPVIELTMRTPAALEAIKRVSAERPDVLLGAGTLLGPEMIRAVHAAGAQFGVSPGTHEDSLAAASELGLPFVPGVVSPSGVLTALNAGLRHLKFFPAAAFGGMATLTALAGPFSATGVRFMPTGGITPDNVADHLNLASVFAVGGTWVAPRADIAAGRWDAIAARAADAVRLVRSLGKENQT